MNRLLPFLTSDKPLSIRRMATQYLVVVVLALALASAVLLLFSDHYSRQEKLLDEQEQQRLIARDIGHLVGFYQSAVDNLARKQGIRDILAFSDETRATAWAEELRPFLPNAIGLGLITETGEVMGEPERLRIGDSCIIDIHRSLKGETVPSPVIHDDVIDLAHFDITSNVYDGETIVGMVFASFSLQVLEQRLQRLLSPGQFLVIKDGAGEAIAVVGDNDYQEHSGPEHPYTAIPGTDWELHTMLPERDNGAMLYPLLSVIFLLAFLVAAVIIVMSMRMVTVITGEFEMILERLRRVKRDERTLDTQTDSLLLDTRDIIGEINLLMFDIHEYQGQLRKRSDTDALTGLMNRGAFEVELQKWLQVARRKVESCLVLLDLDFFKACNDTYGHGVGDEVLKVFAGLISEYTRETDVCARLGGDEFAIIMVNTQGERLLEWHQRVQALFEQQQATLRGGAGVATPCRMSAGAIHLDGRHADLQQALDEADALLYQAKRSGRGRICLQEGGQRGDLPA